MRWSVVVPYYNEAVEIAAMLHSVALQTVRDFHLIVVDNASTDDSEAQCRLALSAYPDITVSYLREPKPGQVHALRRGIAAVRTEFVAVCDADTYYPGFYLENATRVYDREGSNCVAAMGYLRHARDHGSFADKFNTWHWLTAAKVWPQQNHTSGAGHTFRTAALREAGGYDPAIWPYVLKDHELMSRVLRLGHQAYNRDLWCISSDRRTDRTSVRWTLGERLLYHFAPIRDKRPFFQTFLKRRFEARGQLDTVLRERAWQVSAEASAEALAQTA